MGSGEMEEVEVKVRAGHIELAMQVIRFEDERDNLHPPLAFLLRKHRRSAVEAAFTIS